MWATDSCTATSRLAQLRSIFSSTGVADRLLTAVVKTILRQAATDAAAEDAKASFFWPQAGFATCCN